MGRPIRAMGDRALIVLLDRRNIDRTYAICYPPDIRMNQVSDSEGSGRFAKRYFASTRNQNLKVQYPPPEVRNMEDWEDVKIQVVSDGLDIT